MTALWCGGAAAEFIRFIAKINSNHQSLLQFNAPWRVETKKFIFSIFSWEIRMKTGILLPTVAQCPPNLVTTPGQDQRQEALLQPCVE